MAGNVVKFDIGDIVEATSELRQLYGDGSRVPAHIRERIAQILMTREGLSEVVGRRIFAGHELLSILAVLRALKC